MKTKILSVLFLLCLVVSVSAAIRVEKVWQPKDDLAPLRARLSFVQFSLLSDTTERVNGFSVKTEGSAFNGETLLIQNSFGDIIGSARVVPGRDTTFLPTTLVLKAGEPAYLTLQVDRGTIMDAAYRGTIMGADIVALWANAVVSGVFPIMGTRYTENSSLRIGYLQAVGVDRSSQSQNITAGPNQILGSFWVNTSSVEGMQVYHLPVTFHTTNGDASQLRDVVAVDQNGATVAKAWGPRVCDTSSGRVVTFFFDAEKGGIVFPPGMTTTLFFKGNTTDAFRQGGTIALETDVAKWKMYGVTYGYESAISYAVSLMSATQFIHVPRLEVSITSPKYLQVGTGMAQVPVLNILFDATQSSEDIRVTELPILLVTVPQWGRDLSNLALLDGTVKIGEWSGNWPHEGGVARFRLGLGKGNGFVVPKGTAKTITVKVDVSPNAVGFYGVALGDFASIEAVSIQSGRVPALSVTFGYTIVLAQSGKG